MNRPHLARRFAALLASTALVLTGAAVATADDVYNDLDLTIDATAELMQLVAGGAVGTTTLKVQPRNNDGETGCNFGGPGVQELVVGVTSSDTSVATVSPTQLTFTSCDSTPLLTVTGLAPGTSTVTLSLISNTTGSGSFNLAPATFTVNVTSSNTPPSVAVTGVAHGASYEFGSVPTAGCSVTDAEDGPSTFAATLSALTGPYAEFGVGSQTASCSYTDAGGLAATASATYAIVDTSDPTLVGMPSDITEEATGPSGAVVTFTLPTATDAVDPNPVVECAPESGSTFVLGSTEVTCTATDFSDNRVSDSFSVTVEDTTPPDITWIGGPADGVVYVFGSVPGEGSCTALDLVDGVVACNVAGYSMAVGVHTLKATATDAEGNMAEETRSYTVEAWDLKGFYRPVTMGALNTVKGGSTVPLKFEVFAGDTELTSTSVIKGFTVKQVTCALEYELIEDAVDFTTTGGTSLRYDATEGQFIQNWQTPKKPGACYVVTMTTQDGSDISALFKLK
jgi:hypothetical protein